MKCSKNQVFYPHSEISFYAQLLLASMFWPDDETVIVYGAFVFIR